MFSKIGVLKNFEVFTGKYYVERDSNTDDF